jgi:hypothetical protein
LFFVFGSCTYKNPSGIRRYEMVKKFDRILPNSAQNGLWSNQLAFIFSKNIPAVPHDNVSSKITWRAVCML